MMKTTTMKMMKQVSPQWVLTVAHCPDFPNVEDFLTHLSVLLVSLIIFTYGGYNHNHQYHHYHHDNCHY